MRYVDNLFVILPDGWLQRAQNASSCVANGEEPDTYARVWRELKDGLAELFFDKCWYCEMRITRSDNAVDHFRPKGRVSDADRDHRGYRWLAFSLDNLRYSCTFCNSRRRAGRGGTVGGKSDRFPLLEESKRVYLEGPTDAETPTLLDPCRLGDGGLLGCRREDGRPCAASVDPVDRRRACESIELYHLHHEPTCKMRHAMAVTLLFDIEEGKRQFCLASEDSSREVDFQNVAKRLHRRISAKSEFSGDMRFIMRGERSEDHPWIQKLLET